jgi:hypothetical protein
MLLAVIDWTTVIVTSIGAAVTIANGLGITILYTHLRTPSGTKIGKQVEDVNHTARSNWHTLDAVRRDVGITQSPQTVREAEMVDGLDSEDEAQGA